MACILLLGIYLVLLKENKKLHDFENTGSFLLNAIHLTSELLLHEKCLLGERHLLRRKIALHR